MLAPPALGMRQQSSIPISITTHPTMTTTFESAMLSFSPGVNSRAELVTLPSGLRPERRFAPLARGQKLIPVSVATVRAEYRVKWYSVNTYIFFMGVKIDPY